MIVASSAWTEADCFMTVHVYPSNLALMFALHEWPVAHVTMKGSCEHKGDKKFGVITIFPKVKQNYLLYTRLNNETSRLLALNLQTGHSALPDHLMHIVELLWITAGFFP